MAKINVVNFAQLISRITVVTGTMLDLFVIEDLHEMVEKCVVEPVPFGASCNQVDVLLDAMKTGKKIEAIKAYRSITNTGLRESKDAVEKYYYGPQHSTVF